MANDHSGTRRATARPAARHKTRTPCRATMQPEDYETALLAEYHAALAMHAHEPPNAAIHRLNAASDEAGQWKNPRRPRKRKDSP